MKKMHLLVMLAGVAAISAAATDEPVWRESFESLDGWKPLTFPKIERHTEYRVVGDGENSVLQAQADDSASGLVYKETFDSYETPVLRWRWKTANILPEGNAVQKDGDDYPIRIYVFFPYDPDTAGWTMRVKYGLAKRIYGEYPPHSGLNYIWANRRHGQRILPSPYTDRSMMIIQQSGEEHIGNWIEEQVNILDDYRAAFGEDPPRDAALAVMSDADNTAGHAKAWIDWIERRSARDN